MTRRVNNKDIAAFSVIFLFIFFMGIINYLWLSMNKCPPTGDEAYHLEAGLACYNILSDPFTGTWLKLKNMLSLSVVNFYPPLFHALSAVNNLFFGKSGAISIMTNIFFMGISFISIYLLGKRMFDRRTGLLAVFIFAMYPVVFWFSRIFMIETALCAAVTSYALCLLYTEDFKKTGYSVIAGVIFGIGMLLKQLFILSIFGPLLYVAARGLVFEKDAKYKKRAFCNLAISMVIGFALAGLWYLPRLDFLFKRYVVIGYFENNPLYYPVFSPGSFSFYLKTMFSQQLLPFFSVLFFLMAGVFIVSRNNRKIFLIIWILTIWAVFTLIKTKTAYYTLTYLPALALITSGGIWNARIKFLKFFLIFILVFFGLWQFFSISFYKNSMMLSGASRLRSYPREDDWKVSELLSVLKRNCADEKEKNIIFVTHLNRLYAGQDKFPPSDADYLVNQHFLNYLFVFDNLPYKAVNIYSHQEAVRKGNLLITCQKKEVLSLDSKGEYALIESLIMPDKSPVFIYKK